MSKPYKAVNQVLQLTDLKEPGSANGLCCMCLNSAGIDAISVADKVVTEINELDEVTDEEMMGNILSLIVGEQVNQSISLFPSICRSCSVTALNAYNFIKRSRDNIDSLIQAVENLESCFENVSDEPGYESLYVSLDLANTTMQQFYDTRKLQNKEMALARFMHIANGNISDKSGSQKRTPKDFSTIFIKTHELVADPSKPKEYKCKMCLKLYPTSGNLRQHFFATHFKKDFECTMCPKKFGTSGMMQSHMKTSHSVVICQTCGKSLLNRTSTIRRHQMTHVRGCKVCDRCGKSYKKFTDYERHIAQDTCIVPSRTPGSFTCDTCGYHCTYKHQLLTHIKYEHTDAKGHICDWCNRKCYSASALKMHILKHTKEKNFTCSDCGGKFVNKQSLLNHTRLHTGERPYKCDQCDQSFLSASRRKDHIERCHSDTTFDCDVCDAKYSAKRSLIKHKKTQCISVVLYPVKERTDS